MRKLLALAITIAAISGTMAAQSPATVTGTIYDTTNHAASFGTVTFKLQPVNNTIFYRVSGAAILAPTSATCGINASGQLKSADLSGNCQVWGNDVISPSGTSYEVIEAPNGAVAQDFSNAQILGSSLDLSNVTFAANVRVFPDLTTLTLSPLTVSLLPNTDNTYALGASGDRFSALYVNNLFPNNITGFSVFTPAVAGTSDLGSAALPFGNVYIGNAATNNIKLTGTSTVARTATLPNNTGTIAELNLAQTWSAAQAFNSGTILPSAAAGTDLGSTALPFGNLWLGTAATNNFKFQPAVTAAARIITVSDPGGAATLAWLNPTTQQTLTGTLFNTAGTGNTFQINGTGITAVTGTGSAVLASTPTLTNPKLTASSTIQDSAGASSMGITQKLGSGAGDYTTTSASYVDIDGTNLAYTVTVPTGWKALILFTYYSNVSAAAQTGTMALADGTTTLRESAEANSTSVTKSAAIQTVFTGDGASHTFKPRYKVSGGATFTVGNASATQNPVMTVTLMPSN